MFLAAPKHLNYLGHSDALLIHLVQRTLTILENLHTPHYMELSECEGYDASSAFMMRKSYIKGRHFPQTLARATVLCFLTSSVRMVEGLYTLISSRPSRGWDIYSCVVILLDGDGQGLLYKNFRGPFTRQGDTPQDARGSYTKLEMWELTSALGGESKSFCTYRRCVRVVRLHSMV